MTLAGAHHRELEYWPRESPPGSQAEGECWCLGEMEGGREGGKQQASSKCDCVSIHRMKFCSGLS